MRRFITGLLARLGLIPGARATQAAVARVTAAQAAFDEAFRHGDYEAARRLLEEALAAARTQNVPWEITALDLLLGYTALDQRDLARADEAFNEATVCALANGLFSLAAGARLGLVQVAQRRQQFADALTLGYQVVDQYRQIPDPDGEHGACMVVSTLAQARGQHDEARRLGQQCVDHFERKGSNVLKASAHLVLAAAHGGAGDLRLARDRYQRAISLAREAGEKRVLAGALLSLGFCATPGGDYAEEEAALQEALELYKALGDTLHAAYAMNNQGHLARYKGEYGRAADLYRESLRIKSRYEDEWAIAYTLEGLAGVAITAGEARRAASLMGAAEAIRDRLGTPRERYLDEDCRQISDAARTTLGEAFSAAYEEGQSMTWRQAVDYALA